MQNHTSLAGKQDASLSLGCVNDPRSLYRSFLDHLSLEGHSPHVALFEFRDRKWRQLAPNGHHSGEILPHHHSILERLADTNPERSWLYAAGQQGWYCTFKPQPDRKYAMFYAPKNSARNIIDENYVQFLFSLYCHQLCTIEAIYRDRLTGLYNRRAFDKQIQKLMACKRGERSIQESSEFALLDIDHFKRFNKHFGQHFGDELLIRLSHMMCESFMESDLLFRYGGEKFALVLTRVCEQNSGQALERFRKRVEQTSFQKNQQITVSIGYCRFEPNAGISHLVERQALAALQVSKHQGRNQIHCFSPGSHLQ